MDNEKREYQGGTPDQYESSGKIIMWTFTIGGLILLGYGLFEYVRVIFNSL